MCVFRSATLTPARNVQTKAYVSAPPWDDICPQALLEVAQRPPGPDPRRTDDRDLSAHGVHVLVLDAPKRACPQAGTDDDCVDGLGVGASAAEEAGAALDDLGDVLDGPTHDGTAVREEAREEEGEVDGRVDVDGREGRARRRSRDEGVTGELLEL